MVKVKMISRFVLLTQLVCCLGFAATAKSPDDEIIQDLDVIENMDELDSLDDVNNDFEETMPPVTNDDQGMEDQGPPPPRKRGRLPYGDFPAN